ncbi:rRNA methyltransferase 2, mitochondrial isoform X2 [Cylas formicarius]|nr:rRNA methyltransferase 2, mitochondrial isoform X2 [Cylas formicarius]
MKKVVSSELRKSKGVSSNHWLSRQLSDPYVEKAKMMNFRCRSAFKLIEMDDKLKLLKPGQVVIDCGAAPGSWTQVAVKRVNADNCDNKQPQGKVVAIDKQLIYPLEGAIIIGNLDFTNPDSQNRILGVLKGEKADIVISDMAPSATGIRYLDYENIVKLCYLALKFALQISKPGASVLLKLWQCADAKTLQDDMLKFYKTVKIVKPKASRSDSAEIFMLGRDFHGLENR